MKTSGTTETSVIRLSESIIIKHQTVVNTVELVNHIKEVEHYSKSGTALYLVIQKLKCEADVFLAPEKSGQEKYLK